MTNRIKAIIDEAETMKNSYFWKSPSTAGDRRAYERYHSHDKVEWEEGGHKYTAEYTVKCSCNNIYAYGNYTKDNNKTTLKAIKNSYKRLCERDNDRHSLRVVVGERCIEYLSKW